MLVREGMMKHEEFLQRELPVSQRYAGLPETATQAEVVDALVAKGLHAEATELVFCTRREGPIMRDSFGRLLYLGLWTGRLRSEFLRELVRNHQWGSGRGKGFAIEIYPGEFLTITEPTATKVLKAAM